MTRRDLIFDWSKSEGSRKDQLLAVVMAGSVVVFLFGAIKLDEPSYRTHSGERGSLIRLVDPEMARSWALEADENGPFPGRLDANVETEGMMFSVEEEPDWWRDYQVRLRPLRSHDGVERVDITPRGKLEYPKPPSIAEGGAGAVPGTAPPVGSPLLIPYDSAAAEWLPEELPALEMGGLADATEDSLRFLVSLRRDGSVAELIPLAGAADPAKATLEGWLRGIRFKEGSGDRWFGLRVDFVNGRGYGPEPE